MTEPIETTAGAGAVEDCDQPGHAEFWIVHVHGPDETVWFDTRDGAETYAAAILDLTRGKLRPSSPFDPPISAHVIPPTSSRPVVPSRDGGPVDDEAVTLAWMQLTQPWTAPYSAEFEASKAGCVELEPEQHRPLMHDLMHVTKAVGILASIAEWADHGSIRTERVDQAEYEGRIADLVMCALHMANNPPEGYDQFELQRAVIERVERVNGVKWVRDV